VIRVRGDTAAHRRAVARAPSRARARGARREPRRPVAAALGERGHRGVVRGANDRCARARSARALLRSKDSPARPARSARRARAPTFAWLDHSPRESRTCSRTR
jgi:hypothetical protein